VETTNHTQPLASGGAKSPGAAGIVGGFNRVYTDEEEASTREKITIEVTAEFAEKLKNTEGWRRRWLEWRMKCEIDSRTRRYLYGGI